MTTPLLDILKQIADGITMYEPFYRHAEGIREFQDTVHRLRELERLGLIRRLFVEMKNNHGVEYVDFVMVQGGLTPAGTRLLAEEVEPTLKS